jgi:hypothetical protein
MRQVFFVVVLPNGNVVEPRVENGCRVWGSAGRSKEYEVPGGLAEPTAWGKQGGQLIFAADGERGLIQLRGVSGGGPTPPRSARSTSRAFSRKMPAHLQGLSTPPEFSPAHLFSSLSDSISYLANQRFVFTAFPRWFSRK